MTMWHQLAMNPEALSNLYQSVPELQNVDIHRILLHRDGPVMTISLDLPRFPDKPSRRWHEASNTVQIELDFIGLESIELRGWSTDNIVDIQLNRLPDGKIAINISGAMINLRATCVAFRIQRVNAYQKEA
jgi:hypothetical protein